MGEAHVPRSSHDRERFTTARSSKVFAITEKATTHPQGGTLGHRNYRRTGGGEVLRDPALGCRERHGPLVNHAQTAAVDLALAQRNLPFVPLRGGPFGHQCREADDFMAAPRSEDVVVLLPGARLGLSLN